MQKWFSFRARKYNFCASSSLLSSSILGRKKPYYTLMNIILSIYFRWLYSHLIRAHNNKWMCRKVNIVRSEDVFSIQQRKEGENWLEIIWNFPISVGNGSSKAKKDSKVPLPNNYGINLRDIWSDEMIDSSIVGLSAASQSMIFFIYKNL